MTAKKSTKKSKVPVLKVETETVHSVDSYDLEQFIKDVTGHTYETVCNEEWGNDSQHRFAIDGKLHEYERKEWEAFKSTGKEECFRLRTILNGLCSEGHLKAGTYLVTVCW